MYDWQKLQRLSGTSSFEQNTDYGYLYPVFCLRGISFAFAFGKRACVVGAYLYALRRECDFVFLYALAGFCQQGRKAVKASFVYRQILVSDISYALSYNSCNKRPYDKIQYIES